MNIESIINIMLFAGGLITLFLGGHLWISVSSKESPLLALMPYRWSRYSLGSILSILLAVASIGCFIVLCKKNYHGESYQDLVKYFFVGYVALFTVLYILWRNVH